eukprot:760857_1
MKPIQCIFLATIFVLNIGIITGIAVEQTEPTDKGKKRTDTQRTQIPHSFPGVTDLRSDPQRGTAVGATGINGFFLRGTKRGNSYHIPVAIKKDGISPNELAVNKKLVGIDVPLKKCSFCLCSRHKLYNEAILERHII